ncbi:hypothetical protein LTR56_020939 [Elasticomyces elasticus]|nr:hypothetical protein LTR56_020939 [Elasticomyces elasticus]KAK3665209.1 hypothetical protein LTR22_004016 [Elasticomyces elasticus]KAK4909839.1 hypothetical protein LTR49_021437 [Elasticomyces elasticus]KAK5749730.1 hypothetical protein LTS12_020228 [Elasticomyces elasticus]
MPSHSFENTHTRISFGHRGNDQGKLRLPNCTTPAAVAYLRPRYVQASHVINIHEDASFYAHYTAAQHPAAEISFVITMGDYAVLREAQPPENGGVGNIINNNQDKGQGPFGA